MANDPLSLRTAASKVRYLGSARSGSGPARAMHVTSIALMPLGLAFVWVVASLARKDFAAARAELAHPAVAILMLLFVGASIYHMKLGMQVIIDDYIHESHAKSWALIANLFFSALVGLACIYSLLKISFT